jgi:tetratricopeptide (TPR) repeat protein
MKRYILTICLLFGIVASSFAQASIRKLVKSGDEALEQGKYYSALQYYSEAIERDDTNKDVWYKFGTAAYKQHAYKTARTAFYHLVEDLESDSTTYEDAVFLLADLSLIDSKYEDAQRYFKLYLSEFGGNDSLLDIKATVGLSSAVWAQEQIDVSIRNVEHLDEKVNSNDSEHSPVWVNESLDFVSMKFGETKEGRKYSKVLNNKDEMTTIVESGANFNENAYLTSDPSYSKDDSLMVYTKCDFDENDQINCKIYYRVLDKNGYYKLGKSVGNQVNVEGFTSTHPTIVEIDSVVYIYFTSNRPGGVGSYDIWYTEMSETMDFSSPENLSSINTKLDDITPYFMHAESKLYFSSNGRPGYGGYDVYKSKMESAHNFVAVENMGMDVNSSYNDIHFSESEDAQHSFVSSNREGSMYAEDSFETCCYDIYRVEPRDCHVDLLALIFDKVDSTMLLGTHVIVREKESQVIVYNKTLDGSNEAITELDCLKDYLITASKEGYIPETVEMRLTEEGMELNDGEKEQKIYLEPSIVDLNLSVYDIDTNEELAEATVELVSLKSGEESKQFNPDNNSFIFPVEPGGSYVIRTTRPGYEPDETDVFIPSGTKIVEKQILLKKTPIEIKIISLKEVLPIRLFFDNDEPVPNSKDTVTTIQYSATYDAFYSRKEKFSKIYARSYKGSERVDAIGRVDDFFEGELKRNFNNLNIFMSTLVEVLEAGRTVNLYFRGYSSPVAVSEYNYFLGKRRVVSMLLEVTRYRDGVFNEYIENGQLILTERSFGESSAPVGISDDRSDPSKSIYSPEASFERRVEIEEIQVKRNKKGK